MALGHDDIDEAVTVDIACGDRPRRRSRLATFGNRECEIFGSKVERILDSVPIAIGAESGAACEHHEESNCDKLRRPTHRLSPCQRPAHGWLPHRTGPGS